LVAGPLKSSLDDSEGRLAKLYPEAAAHMAQPASTLFVFALPEKGK